MFLALIAVSLMTLVEADPAGPTDVSTPEDCAVFAAVQRSQHMWTPERPDVALFVTAEGRDEHYVVRCPWRALGVNEPVIGTPSMRSGINLFKPTYEAQGLKAKMEFVFFIKPDAARSEFRYFATGQTCDLEKLAGGWRVVACRMSFIT